MISGPLFSISYGWLRVSHSWHSQVSAAITGTEVGLGCGPYQCLLKLGIRKRKKVRGSKWQNTSVVQMGEQNLQSKAVLGRGDYIPLLWLVLHFIQWVSNEKCIRHPRQMGSWESLGFERELIIKPQIYALPCLSALFLTPKIFHSLLWSAMAFTWAVEVSSSFSLPLLSLPHFYPV